MRRVLTAAVLLAILLVLIKQTPAWLFHAVAALAIAVAAWECYGLLEARGKRPFKIAGSLACLALAWSFTGIEPTFAVSLPLVLITIAGLIGAMWVRDEPGSMLDASLATLFPVLFVGLALAYSLALRSQPGEDGEDLVMLLLVCVVAADTAAYYVGTALGRHKMARSLSPSKSWEGAAGGIAASVIAAVVAHLWFFRRLPVGHAVAIGLLVATAAILGDLAESMLKRAAGVKDSSWILPGHGGLLDRADAILFSGPVLYYYWVVFLEGSW